MQTAANFGRRSAQPAPGFASSPRIGPSPSLHGDIAPAISVSAPKSLLERTPWLTVTLLAALAAVYALEVAVSAAGGHPGHASHTALTQLGGLSRDLAIGHGQLWRVLTVSLLHQNVSHLLGNAVALLLVGLLLEPIVGRRWFALIYIVGGLGGALGSLVMNAPQILSVGASGAIMGVLACALVLSLHTASFEQSRRMQMLSLRVMVPALLPLSGVHGHVDYSAHIGGAVTGAMLGFLLQIVWSEDRPRPPQALLAGCIAGSAAAVSGLALAVAAMSPAGAPVDTPGLIPIDDTPTSGDGWSAHASQLARQYPADPRPHVFKALDLVKARQEASAETELLVALQSPLLTAPELPVSFVSAARVALIGVYAREGRMDKAKTAAAPLCDAPASVEPKILSLLQKARLCGPT